MKIERLDTLSHTLRVDPATSTEHQQTRKVEQVKPVERADKVDLRVDGHQLRFGVDQETHKPVVRVVNEETGEIIDQIPRESWSPFPPSNEMA
jgi:uncharacterized FlaG/YvyC family protein